MSSKEEIFITDSFEETKKIGKKLAKSLGGSELIALYGDLGGGKTTFVQGLALGLGIERRIISPTFIIVRTYKIKSKNFYHIDLYRAHSSQDLESLGLPEIINDENSIKAIEWAENLKNLLPEKRIDVFFEYLEENKRKIKIIKYGIKD